MKIKIIASTVVLFPLMVFARVSDLNSMISENLQEQVQIQQNIEHHAQENADRSCMQERSQKNALVIDIGENPDYESIKNIPMSYNQ